MKLQNYIVFAVAVTLITAGFTLMRPPIDVKVLPNGHHSQAPGPGAMDHTRIHIAPIICLTGYLLMVPGILLGMRNDKK